MSAMMQSRLLSRLHRVFDRNPQALLALRLRSPGGLRWTVAGDVLTVSRPELPDLMLPLAGASIGQVRQELVAAGVEIAFTDPDLDRVGAQALLPGSGDQDASNGDHLLAYTSILWGWTDTVGRVLDTAKADIAEALKQLTVPTAEGEWLELWASYFGLQRRTGETDVALAERTILEPRRPRSNPTAMRANIKRMTGLDLEVREPWREMFTLGVSELSGSDHLPDDREYGYHRIQLVSTRPTDFTAAMREAEMDRPAGTLLLPPAIHLPPVLVYVNAGSSVLFGLHDARSWLVVDYDGQILDYNFVLGDSFVRMNPQISATSLYSVTIPGLPEPHSLTDDMLTICRGEMVLSYQGELGGEQSHLPGRDLVEVGEMLRLSEAGPLSDYEWSVHYEPIDIWSTDSRSAVLPTMGHPDLQIASGYQAYSGIVVGAGSTSGNRREVRSIYAPKTFGGGWQGKWDARRWSDTSYRPPVVHGITGVTIEKQPMLDSNGGQIFDENGNPIMNEVQI